MHATSRSGHKGAITRRVRSFLAIMVFAALMVVPHVASAAPKPIPMVGSDLVFNAETAAVFGTTYSDVVLPQEYRFYKVSMNLAYSFDPVTEPEKAIVAGDYFEIELDSELYLHPNADVSGNSNQLPPLKMGDVVIATPSIVPADYMDPSASDVIRYTFTAEAEPFNSITPSISFNNSVKVMSPRHGAGTVHPFLYQVGATSLSVSLRHGEFPVTPESIYHINS